MIECRGGSFDPPPPKGGWVGKNLPPGTQCVGSLQLPYISKVSEATAKQKPKAEFCFVINAGLRRYFLQANDKKDLLDWVDALNKSCKITVPKDKANDPQPCAEINKPATESQIGRKQIPYKTEIIGGVVVQTPITQVNGGESQEAAECTAPGVLKRTMSHIPLSGNKPTLGPQVLKSGFCVKQGIVRKSWKRRYFTLDENSFSYFKCELEKEPLRAILLKDIQKAQNCSCSQALMRDNLFEIVTTSRTFYIQADSPAEMQSWMNAINEAIKALRGSCNSTTTAAQSSLIGRTPPLPLIDSSAGPSPAPSASLWPPSSSRPHGDEKRPLAKSTSVVPSWQPWTPVPTAVMPPLSPVEEAGGRPPAPNAPSEPAKSQLAVKEDVNGQGKRRRHRSQPAPQKEQQFQYNIDDDGIRTTDV
uniref:pleckstrin homology domain-containing family A member 2-like isoform X2 n=1 Tax=Pristiophorus japonicus TaxID=55135 RepID=UPI00398F6D01